MRERERERARERERTRGERMREPPWFLNSFLFTFAIIYFQIVLQGNVPFSYFTPLFPINERKVR